MRETDAAAGKVLEFDLNMNLTRFINDSVFWINDVFDKDELTAVLNRQLPPQYIVNDHFNKINIPGQKIYCAPLWLAKEVQEIVKTSVTPSYQTEYTFNFMINKKQINRFLCIKFVEMFRLQNYNYTWSGIDNRFNLSDILDELNSLGDDSPITDDERSFLLSSITIPSRFFYRPDDNAIPEVSISYNGNDKIWEDHLHTLFSSSVTSLITESLTFQEGTVFTEKTAYAILGKTFPIWIGGGIQQAEEFEEMGFDAFTDIIDHSYQYYDTLIQRCYYAFKQNLHILTDFEYAKQMREKHMARLDKNQQLMNSNQIANFCKHRINQWPVDLQQSIRDELTYWI
jgi:hypothetical protein